ncbi:MAG: hypothetical protein AAF687_00675 [Pseudomonadota bacterium]
MSELVHKLEGRNMWPWPYALAWAFPKSHKHDACRDVAHVLLDPRDVKGRAIRAISVLVKAAEPTTKRLRGSTLRSNLTYAEPSKAQLERQYLLIKAEEKLVDLLQTGGLIAWARQSPHEPLQKLGEADWIGSEVHYEDTCDVCAEGTRAEAARIKNYLSESIPSVRRYFDVHITSASLKQQFNMRPGLNLQLVPASAVGSTWALSEAKNKAIFGHHEDIVRQVSRNSEYSQAESETPTGNRTNGSSGAGQEGYRRIGEALKTGEIDALIQNRATGQYFRVPKDYWLDWREGENIFDIGVDEAFVGQPILVDESRMDAWIECASAMNHHPSRTPPRATDAEILERCDQLWLQGSNVRDLDKDIPREPKFQGVKAMVIRELTKGRYSRGGRRIERTPDMIKHIS